MEDPHWIDPSTLELLSLPVDRGPTARILARASHPRGEESRDIEHEMLGNALLIQGSHGAPQCLKLGACIDANIEGSIECIGIAHRCLLKSGSPVTAVLRCLTLEPPPALLVLHRGIDSTGHDGTAWRKRP
jgi:hypothetical protein